VTVKELVEPSDVKRKVRTKAALAAKAARGERIGTVPFGFRLHADGVHLEPDAREQTVIATACCLRTSGLTLQAIVDELQRRGMLNRKGNKLSLTAVHKMTRPSSRRRD
jgi:hypothetical protein